MIAVSLTLSIPPPWNHHRLRPTPPLIKCESGGVPLPKQGHRFLSSLASTADVDDPITTNRLIKKFVASSPKSIALNALSHLLSPRNCHPHLSDLAFPLYTRITETSWYLWNPKLVAELIPLLYIQGKHDESEALISQAVSKLKSRERDLVQFYCNLIESCSKHESKQGFNEAYCYLSELVRNSSSVYVKRQGYKSMVSSLCEMGQPDEAENVVEDMRKNGVKPSLFEFSSLAAKNESFGNSFLSKDLQFCLEFMSCDHVFVLDEVMEWTDLELKLDLHGMHLGSAYVIMLLWIEEMKRRFKVEECVIPAQITIVCGSGKHSSVRGESPVKILIKEMMIRMKSPMKIDWKNIGCFIAKGQVVKNWLSQLM
ncbi:Mitochondrial editing factor 9 isoform 1 [Hibiscus syriacus]|uniref:Mitochondrial editing factor 9 isoform 1 n=1 Tax=Hibiscus syriacus TaxID=106335 RepID=A0A6A2Y8G4_HIBSY|nr:Mitochondrial editing factor 9 isoform 1 [Hibiscus syriacus]